MRARRWAAAAVVAASLAGAALLPSAAAAQDFSASGALWYVDAMKLSAIHDAGIDGEGVTIAVFDDGLNRDAVGLKDADIEVRPLDACPDPTSVAATDFEGSQHGTSVTSLIAGNGTSDSGEGPVGIAPKARILYYGVIQDGCEGNPYPAALDDAVAQGADIVTISGGAPRLDDELTQPTIDSVTAALRAGVVLIAGLPNRDTIGEFELMTINGVVNVGSVGSSAQLPTERDGSEMTNEDVDVVAPGIDVAGVGFDGTWGMSTWSGNSAATPLVAGLMALAKQSWPDATASQLLQSLIRNTGPEAHELEWSNTYGYGIVNATRIVDEDPTQYADENPLFKDDQQPSFDDVFSAQEVPSTSEPAPDAPASIAPWLIGGGVVVVIVIVVVVVLASRKKTGGRRDV